MKTRIDVGKSVAGGVLAGIVLAGFDFVSNNFLLAEAWQNVAQRHNIDPALMGSGSALATMIIADLLLGQVLVLTYAAVRPRFGPGAGTAAIAAFLIFLPEALLLASLSGWFVSWDLYFRQSVVLLVSTLSAGLAGAWVYAEKAQE